MATGHLPQRVSASDPDTGTTYRLACSIRGHGSRSVCVTPPPAMKLVVVPIAGIAGPGPKTTNRHGFTPTPAQLAKAKQALAFCRRDQPSVTLEQLEREAASAVGIQC